jgi:hypothetical protein
MLICQIYDTIVNLVIELYCYCSYVRHLPEAKTFKALCDPVRLEMICRLSDSSLYTVDSLSDVLG